MSCARPGRGPRGGHGHVSAAVPISRPGLRVLDGPRRVGSERRWRVQLPGGDVAVLGQLLPELASDESIRRRYVRDIERLRELEVEGLAPILEFGPQPDPRAIDADPPWRLRADPEGETLESWLARRAPAPVDEVAQLMARLAGVVHRLHARGGRIAGPASAVDRGERGRGGAADRRGARPRGHPLHAYRRQSDPRGFTLRVPRAAASDDPSISVPICSGSASSSTRPSPGCCPLATGRPCCARPRSWCRPGSYAPRCRRRCPSCCSRAWSRIPKPGRRVRRPWWPR